VIPWSDVLMLHSWPDCSCVVHGGWYCEDSEQHRQAITMTSSFYTSRHRIAATVVNSYTSTTKQFHYTHVTQIRTLSRSQNRRPRKKMLRKWHDTWRWRPRGVVSMHPTTSVCVCISANMPTPFSNRLSHNPITVVLKAAAEFVINENILEFQAFGW